MTMSAAAPIDWGGQKKINLALQGGGAHGAFTWGVLDALLEDGRLDIEAITGTSAGAMNAVVLARGLLRRRRATARGGTLEEFLAVRQSTRARCRRSQRKVFDGFFGAGRCDASPAYWWFDVVTHYASPYDFNPLDINPLRDHLADDDRFRAGPRLRARLKLFIAATNVETGKIAVFERDDAHRRSCDGLGLPAAPVPGRRDRRRALLGRRLYAAIRRCSRCSTRPIATTSIIVQINPIERAETPRSAARHPEPRQRNHLQRRAAAANCAPSISSRA